MLSISQMPKGIPVGTVAIGEDSFRVSVSVIDDPSSSISSFGLVTSDSKSTIINCFLFLCLCNPL